MKQPLKILHLEDNATDADLVKRCIQRAGIYCEFKLVQDKIDFQNSLKYFSPDVILSDHRLPQFDSTEALKMAKVRRENANTPFILVTGTVSEEYAVQVLKEGADDYILKKNLSRLPAAIEHALRQREAEQKLAESETRLRTTLDALLEGVQIISKEFRYLYVNDAVAQQGKRTRQELLGHTMMEKYPGIEHTPFFSVLRRCMDERVPEIVENEFTYPDGTKGWFELSIQPAPEGVIILSMDITRRKLAEEKLIQSERQIRNFATRLTKTVEDERARIARELHDELSGQLAGLKMGLSSLKTNHRELTEPIDQLMKNADDAMHAVRKVIADLRPAMLDSLGFIPSLDWLAKEFQKKSGITCRVEAEEEIQIDNGDAISIFRICQEALTNVLKHSEASKVTITLKKENEKIILKIKDNGKGIQSEKLANPFSVGLIGMRERARMINAEFSISSEKNVGTTIILSKLAAEPRRTEIVSSN